MSIAKVTLWGKYVYEVNMTENMSIEDMAMAISLEVHLSEHKTRFSGVPRTYEYVYECLLRKSCYSFRVNVKTQDERKLLQSCNELHNKSEWIKKVDANGIGYYHHQDYRMGYTQSNILIIDVDGTDVDNLSNVKHYYENVLKCKFRVIQTKKGYWLFSDKKYPDMKSWLYDNCRVLNPYLKYDELTQYRNGLLDLDNDELGGFKKTPSENIKSSVFYKATSHISFDVMFQFLSIKRERSTIRITKKGKDDKIHAVDI